MSSSFLSLSLCPPLTYICALPIFCSFGFLPPSFYRFIAVSVSSAEQLMPRGPASLSGRVMYVWLALTSLQAQRHSNSVLPVLLFLMLSLSASASFLLIFPLHYSPLSSSFFSLSVSSSVTSPLFYCSPFSASTTVLLIIFHGSVSC